MSECLINLEERRLNDVSNSTKDAIRLVTAHIETLPVGTFKYKLFKYPGDIDIFERIEGCTSDDNRGITSRLCFNEGRIYAAHTIQSIVQDIIEGHNIIFVEFKAGYDFRYKIYTGIVNGTIEDFDPVLVQRDIDNLYQSGLIDHHEHNILCSLLLDHSNGNIIKINEILRDYWVVRWTAEEVLQGYKVLRGNYRLYLDVALTQGSIVKLDTIAYIDSRFVEVTNFLVISIDNKIVSQELGDYQQSLTMDFYKYFDNNTLKAIKRLWMLLVFKRRNCDLERFRDLFSSHIALYSQILADIETAITLIERDLDYDCRLLYQSLIQRLSLLKGLCLFGVTFISMDNLRSLQDCLQQEVNTMTKQWLVGHNINPFEIIQRL